MKELTILLFCIIAMFVYMNYIRKSLHLSLIESSIDNQKYLVRNLKDNKEAANKLAQLSQSLVSLINPDEIFSISNSPSLKTSSLPG